MSRDHSELINELEQKLGYIFNDKGLLMEALTHKSYYYENRNASDGYNERLEFLGDSVLGLAIAGEVFARGEVFDESMMSKVKSYIVKGDVLSDVADDHGLGGYLLLGRGERDSGGSDKRSVKANAMEAVIGAVYVDAGYEDARALVMRFFGERLEESIRSELYRDFKSDLQEGCQERYSVLPVYRIISEQGLEHEKTFEAEVSINDEVYGVGKGKSKKDAQQAAAKEALEKLQG